jgi:excinuclease ABC subunit A
LPLEAQTVSQMVDQVLALAEGSRLMILAPVVANRKGEQLELIAELRAQGFARLRVDGQIHEIDAVPKLAKTHKHTIDVVVDRLKVREDIRQRLAESFETALRHADGRAIAYEMDSEREHFFSARFACPVCSYSIQELEPRIFSFNSPMGACQKCDGLGVIQFFDPRRIVARPESVARRRRDPRLGPAQPLLLSDALRAGRALRLRASTHRSRNCPRTSGRSFSMVPGVSNCRSATSTSVADRAHASMLSKAIVVNLERRYKESDSLAVREELARLISNQTCPACQGSRLREEARNVRVGSKDSARTLHEISRQPLAVARDYFLSCNCPATRRRWPKRCSRKSSAACSS